MSTPFFGATPRGKKATPPVSPRGEIASSSPTRCSDGEAGATDSNGDSIRASDWARSVTQEMGEILDLLRHGQSQSDALMKGVKTSALGQERMEACVARRRDAAQVLQTLERVVDKPATDWSDEEERRNKFNRVHFSLEGFRKALATLDAYERVAERTCKPGCPSLQGSPRLSKISPREAMGFTDSGKASGVALSPRGVMLVNAGSASGMPPACGKLSHEATSLMRRVAAARGEDSFEDQSGIWGWFVNIACCTSRPDIWDHEAVVEGAVASLDRLAYQARRGDILCCAPADMTVNAVRYFHSPGAEGSGGNPVYRGDKILMQGRRGGWGFNKNGWLPLWHPISCHPDEASVLFAFDHHSTTFEDDESSDDSDYSHGSGGAVLSRGASTSPRLTPRSQRRQNSKAHLMFHRRGGN